VRAQREWPGSADHVPHDRVSAPKMSKSELNILVSHKVLATHPEGGASRLARGTRCVRTPGKENSQESAPWKSARKSLHPFRVQASYGPFTTGCARYARITPG